MTSNIGFLKNINLKWPKNSKKSQLQFIVRFIIIWLKFLQVNLSLTLLSLYFSRHKKTPSQNEFPHLHTHRYDSTFLIKPPSITACQTIPIKIHTSPLIRGINIKKTLFFSPQSWTDGMLAKAPWFLKGMFVGPVPTTHELTFWLGYLCRRDKNHRNMAQV